MGTAYDGLSTLSQRAAAALHALEQAMQTGGIDPRVLGEFRDAVDHLRRTAGAAQQWVNLRAQKRDAYAVLPLLTAERIRRTTRLCHDLAMDMDANEVSFESEGIQDLFQSVERLYERLARLCGR
ncbi:MAG: hypothetical protein ACE5HL_08530 [Terriglobia bacterium]